MALPQSPKTETQTIQKRLIISGITPAISSDDISRRFSSFGTVTTVDGIGKLDGNGQPRKYGYVSLATTQPKLTRCLNLLNGSTWKGAKLRIGEARPDWRKRLEKESDSILAAHRSEGLEGANNPPRKSKKPPKKKARRLRGTQGREASDMRSITLQNVQHRKYWKTTALGHLIRPIRMRPSHSLPILAPTSSSRVPTQRKSDSKRKLRPPITRARLTMIDPTRYGAVHITAESGILGAELVGYCAPDRPQRFTREALSSAVAEVSENDEEEERPTVEGSHDDEMTPAEHNAAVSNQVATREVHVGQVPNSTSHGDEPSLLSDPNGEPGGDIIASLTAEKSRSLAILSSLFGAEDSAAPGWQPDSDLEEEIQQVRLEEQRLNAPPKFESESESSITEEDVDASDDNKRSVSMESGNAEGDGAILPLAQLHKDTAKSTIQMKSLKDMFAPREEEAGFTLFASLNLSDDIELDQEMAPSGPESREQPLRPWGKQVTAPSQDTSFYPTPASDPLFDPNTPFFFLLPRDPETGLVDLPGGAAGRKGARPKDLLDTLKGIGPDRFWKMETDEEIGKQWDEIKGNLTQEYKRRHREAIKKKRRGVGGTRADGNME